MSKTNESVAKDAKGVKGGVNVQELAGIDTFALEGVASPEFVQKAVLNALQSAGYNIIAMKPARGGGYVFNHEVKVTK